MGMASAELHEPHGLTEVSLDLLDQGMGQMGISKFVNEFHVTF